MDTKTLEALNHVLSLAEKSAVPESHAMYVFPELIPKFRKEQESIALVKKYIQRNDHEDL